MTVKRLRRELGPGEMAYWQAKIEIENDWHEQARKDAERQAKHK